MERQKQDNKRKCRDPAAFLFLKYLGRFFFVPSRNDFDGLRKEKDIKESRTFLL